MRVYLWRRSFQTDGPIVSTSAQCSAVSSASGKVNTTNEGRDIYLYIFNLYIISLIISSISKEIEKSLRLVDHLTKHLRALSSLGQATEHPG